MAKVWIVNTSIAGGSALAPGMFYTLKSLLKMAGWPIPSSSDGGTYNSSGDQITHIGTGAGGAQNDAAWFRAREPGGRREWLFQWRANTGAGHARIKYSALSRFTAGSPSATRVPTAADEQVLIGGGTDASPSYTGVFPSASGTGSNHKVHCVANTTPIGGAYPFYLLCMGMASITPAAGFIAQEPMAPGTYTGADGDPVVVFASSQLGVPTQGQAWFGYGTAGQSWATGLSITSSPIYNGALGVDVGDQSDINGRSVFSASISSSPRQKGVGATFGIKGPARTYPATLNLSTDNYMYLGSYLFPYPDNVSPDIA